MEDDPDEKQTQLRFPVVGGKTYDFVEMVRTEGHHLRRSEDGRWEAKLFYSLVEEELRKEPGGKEQTPEWVSRFLKAVEARCIWTLEPEAVQSELEASYQRFLKDHRP